MKYLVLLLALAGCADQKLYSSPPATPDKIGPAVSSIASGVQYKCQASEVNDKLVWIPCEFRNLSFEPQRICIQISYVTNETSSEIATSRKICTSVLRPDETYDNYGAFIKNKRELLTAMCGVGLESCRMVIKAL